MWGGAMQDDEDIPKTIPRRVRAAAKLFTCLAMRSIYFPTLYAHLPFSIMTRNTVMLILPRTYALCL
jgi:hypothetical protein